MNILKRIQAWREAVRDTRQALDANISGRRFCDPLIYVVENGKERPATTKEIIQMGRK